MFSDNLLFPTDLLDRHYNVKLPDMIWRKQRTSA